MRRRCAKPARGDEPGIPDAATGSAVLWLELLYILRDRTSRALLVGVPALRLALFGYAVDLDPHG